MKKDKIETIAIRQSKEKVVVLEKLMEYPIISSACRAAGVGRATFYRWCDEDVSFAEMAQRVLSKGKYHVSDVALSKLLNAIKNNEPWAIMFWLRHNHPDYKASLNIKAEGPNKEGWMRKQTKLLQFLANRKTGKEVYVDDDEKDTEEKSIDESIAELKKALGEQG